MIYDVLVLMEAPIVTNDGRGFTFLNLASFGIPVLERTVPVANCCNYPENTFK